MQAVCWPQSRVEAGAERKMDPGGWIKMAKRRKSLVVVDRQDSFRPA